MKGLLINPVRALWIAVFLFVAGSLVPAFAESYQTQAEAYAACQAQADSYTAQLSPSVTGGPYYVCKVFNQNTDGSGSYMVWDSYPGTVGWIGTAELWTVPNPPASCTAGVRTPNVWLSGTAYPGGSACQNGCAVSDYIDVGGSSHYGVETTGASCTVGPSTPAAPSSTPNPPPQSETCSADGSTCTYCDTVSGNCVTSANPRNAPPPITGPAGGTSAPPPPNLGSPGTPDTASGGTSGSSSGGGSSGSGGSGSGSGSSWSGSSGVITGNNGSQPANNGDYSSNPAHSTSTGCTAGDACNAGQASGVIGTLYQRSGDSLSAEYGKFTAAVGSSPIITAATGFFTFTPSGSCPTWHIPGNKYWGQAGFDFTFFCNPAFLTILQLAGYLVLAVGAFSAFRVALY